MDEPKEIPPGITRRQALKRGLLIGGGLLWATPSLQIVNMSRAYAQVPSPGDTSTPPEAEVSGKTLTNTEVEAESLPFTGGDVLPLAGLGAGLIAAGAASLQIARQIEDSGGSGRPDCEPAEGG
jgi:hypothetical protein